ncbi:NAD(P)/FAD-dependent oxidoreductase [Marinobacterium rhizophilum]|uniref:NAD(P)/FAD-dependent oxidoreductase n=1 Tax=Marinobacterium rhizophilum TaxID=420402 RepID=UPI002106B95B|nr:FAD-dependent oxidoreductase [Marinobacterium rhizophilum]
MKQRILIVGAGFGGMWSALSSTRLLDKYNRHDIEVTVLAPQAELRVRPRFYEPEVHTMAAPLGELFDAVGVTFVKGLVEHIDVVGKSVKYRDDAGAEIGLAYDRLVLATGSKVAQPALPGIEAAFNIDNLDEAIRLERHIKSLADVPVSVMRNTVVVAGGGFTGIEIATELPSRLREVLGNNTDIRVVVADRGAEIGAAMGDGPRDAVVQACNALGVEWKLNVLVVQWMRTASPCRMGSALKPTPSSGRRVLSPAP